MTRSGWTRTLPYTPMPDERPLSVTELMARLRQAVEVNVGEQRVVGEIGSCKVASSGHIYFTLKDASAQLACVLYRFQAGSCRVQLREGLQVELEGRATVWEGRGALQFIVARVREAGMGTLQQQFERLKQKLAAEGLFDESRKRPIPRFPRSVGLITSATGAVIQDMRHRLEQRAPWMRAYLLPVQVQGKGAELGLARAVRAWGQGLGGLPQVDYLIIARGGGSMEDLWCFNEEVLARAIAECPLPVVSAVGHETDVTIADFVADLRAPTPTAAIELTTPDGAALGAWMADVALSMRRRLMRALETARLRLRTVEHRYLRHPLELLAQYAQRLDVLEEELRDTCAERLQRERTRLEMLHARLAPVRVCERMGRTQLTLSATEQRIRTLAQVRLTRLNNRLQILRERWQAANPQNALRRGFALVRTADGRLARRAQELQPGAQLDIALCEGQVRARVLGGKTPPPAKPGAAPAEGLLFPDWE